MLDIIFKIFLLPFRFVFYLYNKITYAFLSEKTLYLKIPSSLSYYEKTGILKFLKEKEENHYFSFLLQLNHIAEENKIKNLILEIPSIENLEWNQVEDIIFLLQKIRSNGKTIYGYADEGGIKTILILASCDFRYTGDWSQFYIILPHFEQFYLGDFFKNIGIEIEVFSAGKYKSAGEMYSKNKISSYAKENILELIEDRRKFIYNYILQTPNIKDEIKNKLWQMFLDQSIISGKDLFNIGFIHQLVDKVCLKEYIAEKKSPFISTVIEHSIQGQGDTKSKNNETIKENGSKFPEIITKEQFLSIINKHHFKFNNLVKLPEVAILVMDGIITKGDEESHPKAGIINAYGYIKLLKELKDSKEKAIVIYINSPGGMSDASELLYQEIRKLSRIKPVYILQGSVAASGGYYISCAGNKIYSYHSSITGSIGVLRLRPFLQELYKKFKINKSKLMFDKTTSIFSESTPLNKESKDLLEKSTNETYHIFLERVARGRGKLIEQVKHFAEGRVFTAYRFKEAGLVDENITFLELLEIIKQDLKLKKPQKIRLNFYPIIKLNVKELFNIKNLLQNSEIYYLKNFINVSNFFNKDWYISLESINLFFNKEI